MARGKATRAKQMNPQLRRKLSEEGKRLLRHALAHDDEIDHVSVDLSIVTNCDDSSAGSDLESVLEWEQVNDKQFGTGSGGGGGGGGGGRNKRAQRMKYGFVDGDRHQELEDAMEELTEKRDTIKIQALQKILSMLCGSVMTDRVQSSKVTLTANTLSCLKKRMKESGSLALRVLGVLAITIGPDEQEYYDDIQMPLQRLFTDSGDAALRVEAVYALSIACFVCCNEDHLRWELIDTLGSFLVAAKDAEDDEDEFPETLITSVMECWGFLVSYFRPSMIVSKIYDPNAIIFEHANALAAFVREGMHPSVRSAACEVLALLIQFKYSISQKSWSYELESKSSPIGGLETKIEKYMRETGKNIGKKTRKVQRSMLKEVLETLRTGEGPHKDLQIEDETLSISTWSRFFQANVFRRALQSGFQVHLVDNEVLREAFDVSDNANAKLNMVSTVQRRANHKTKAVHKRNDMSRKDMAQNAFLYDD